MLDGKEPEVEVIENDPEPDTDNTQQVVVDLEKKEDPKKVEDPKPVQSTSSEDIKKLHNTIAYQTRKLDQAMRELQEVRTQLSSRPAPVQSKESTELDEIDEIAQKDWKLGVRKVVEKDIETKVQELLLKREQIANENQRKASLELELSKSKQRVISKYPQVEDDSSEESAIYRQVVNEDSTLLSNIHGPEIAMYRMEERMREMGKTPASVKPIVDKEVNRLVRAGASSVIGRQGSPNGKIVLTKDQKEFCDHYKIPYEQYAKNLKASDASGGIEA